MDFASAYVLEEGEEEESDHEDDRRYEMESELISNDNNECTFECEVMDFDEEDEIFQPKKQKKKSQGSSLNTVNLKLQVLKDEDPEQILKDTFRYTCANVRNCGAILSHIDTPIDIPGSTQKMWVCRFCGVERIIKQWPEFKDCPNGDVLFVNDPAVLPKMDLNPGENTVILVLDCSGSMSHPVNGQSMMGGGMNMMGGGMNMMAGLFGFMGGHTMPMPTGPTRLEALRDGVVKEIKKLKTDSPDTRVGLVYFNNEIKVVGDGSAAPVTLSGSMLNDYTELLTTGQRQATLGPVSQSCDKLVDALQSLKEGGQTALGPALVVAMAMAGKTKTSKVILCTDGYANIGLGNLMSGVTSSTDEFYKDVTLHCKTQGVSVSLVSFDECGYAKALGELPVETGGLLWRVNPNDSDLKIEDVLTRQTMATDAFVKFVCNKQLYVENAADKEMERSNFKHLVGNIHNSQSIAFKFGFRRDEESKKQRQDVKDQNGFLDEKPLEPTLTITEIKDDEKDKAVEKKDENTNEKKENPDEKSGENDGSIGESKELVVYDPAKDPNKEFVPFQVQIYYVDLDGTEATRIWTSLKPITANKQKVEEASNKSVLITNMIQTASKRLLEIFNGKLLDVSLHSEARKMKENANKLLGHPDITEGETRVLNVYMALLSKISSTSNIDDEVAEKLRNFQASGVQIPSQMPEPIAV